MQTFASSGPESSRRRSQRVVLSIPVTVSGETAQGPFTEKTHTLVINAHGALIIHAAKVVQGQKLRLKSATNPETQACSVVFVGPAVEGKTQFGVEFSAAAPNFWQIAFPPPDWAAPTAEETNRAEKVGKK
jgi:hypothetical protein